jgi:hexosaminidase
MKYPSLIALAFSIMHLDASTTHALVPLPASVTEGHGSFIISSDTIIRHSPPLTEDAVLIAADFKKIYGLNLKLVAESAPENPSEIVLRLDTPATETPLGSYTMDVTTQGIKISGADAAGVFYASRSLLQLAPIPEKPLAQLEIPAISIVDAPRYAWRGMHLDVGRHMFPLEKIKGFLDQMAFHKLNTFHWHLTEDQGWRIEIKKYPKLTEIGAFRDATPPYGDRQGSDGKRYGGFYTQLEVKELVAYAAARHITIVPEIELPGHAAAAIAAYPELGNDDIPDYAPKVATSWGVFPYIFAPKEKTFEFLTDVMAEVCELFPSKFIHIGGDEAPKDQWVASKFAQEVIKREGLKDEHELQSYFIRRIETILAAKGRSLIGWDEIQEGGLSKTAAMMVWRDLKWAQHALDQGNQVVMAPYSHTYLDYYQAPPEKELAKGSEFEGGGGFVSLAKLYSYNPSSVARNAADEKLILGVQAQLWTEFMHDWKKLEYMAFPRIAGLAEIAWTPQEKRDYKGFSERMEPILLRYKMAGINAAEIYQGAE